MYQISINGGSVEIKDRRATASQVLAAAGFVPVDEHVLIGGAKVGSRLISLDECINLEADDIAHFYAFRTGEVFTFTVNAHGYQWGRSEITEAELRTFANVPEEDVIVFERSDAEFQIVGADGKILLDAVGTEHLKTKKRSITVFYDGVAKLIPLGTYSTEELLAIFLVPAGYLLNLADKDGLHALKPYERVHVKDDMRFFSQVPGGGSS